MKSETLGEKDAYEIGIEAYHYLDGRWVPPAIKKIQ
jgi:hypothetical protein